MHNEDEPREVHIDAADADWIKGARVRLSHDGRLLVRDPRAGGGTATVEPGTERWYSLLDRLDSRERMAAVERARENGLIA